MNELKACYDIFILSLFSPLKSYTKFQIPPFLLVSAFVSRSFSSFTFCVPYEGCMRCSRYEHNRVVWGPLNVSLVKLSFVEVVYTSLPSHGIGRVTLNHSFSFPSTFPERCSIVFVIISGSSRRCRFSSVSIRRSIHELRFLRFRLVY